MTSEYHRYVSVPCYSIVRLWIYTAGPGFNPWQLHETFLVDEVALYQVLLRVLWFYTANLNSNIPPYSPTEV
jgi:hypothetical protein